jgi:ADP-ribose pyrophosphatase
MPLTLPPNGDVLLETKRFCIVRQRRMLANGKEFVRDTVQHAGSVVIIPLLDDGRVCLLRNYRLAVGETLVELPAGTLDRDEPPLKTAARELAEETGYNAARIEPLTEFLMSPGILNERTYVYVATGLAPGAAALEPGEEIETFLADWEEALGMIDDGRIVDAKTVAAMLVYERRGRGRVVNGEW